MAGEPAGPWRRIAVAIIALIALLLAVATAGQGAAGASTPPIPGLNSMRLLLRLHDLPPGYTIHAPGGETSGPGGQTGPRDVFCAALDPNHPQPPLAEFLDQFSPAGCITVFWRIFAAPGQPQMPPIVGTGALDAGSVAAAEAGLAVAPELLGNAMEEMPDGVPAPATIGDATRLFHWKKAPFGETASFLAWRSRNALAVVLAAGDGSFAANDRQATALARMQQAHLEHPSPYTEAERYDSEVYLDAPWETVPVLWLGRQFTPGHGLRPIQLSDAVVRRVHQGHQQLFMAYSHGIFLSSWRQRRWKAPAAAGVDRWAWHCTVRRPLRLTRGRAVLFAAYEANYGKCPARPPHHRSALVQLDGTAVMISVESCDRRCSGATPGGYGSFRGLEAIIRGLRLRPKPVY